MLDPGRSPDKIVLIETGPDGGSQRAAWPAHDLDAVVDAVARGLVKRGLQRGDTVGILSLNRWEFVAVYFGAMRAGLVAVPINWKLPPETVSYISSDSRVKLFFADAERVKLVPAEYPCVSFDDAAWNALLNRGPFESVTPSPDETAQVLYTSGSTGRPKGVPLSHSGQRWAVEVFSTEDVGHHRLLVAAPMFHMNALFNLKFAFHNRASVVLMPQFSARAYIDAIIAHGVTWITSVPTMLAMVANEIGERPPPKAFRNITRVYMGSSPFGQSLLNGVRRLFPNAAVSNAYGTTEAGPAVFGRHPAGRPTPDLSMGYPLPGVELRIVDAAGKSVGGPGEGILQMRTPALMSGYLNLPEQTERALREGWYHTNDIVRRDADGFYYFVGRADDMFVSSGENIYPGEIEKMIEGHAGVHQAVVVPVPDPIKQALPFAFVVREPGREVAEADVKQWALQRGPAYMHPRWVEFLDAMPLAGTNKIDRPALRQRAATIAASRGR
jgi:acyl-CoA synthetase (AMP-forming)/AMP-acid ligase II